MCGALLQHNICSFSSSQKMMVTFLDEHFSDIVYIEFTDFSPLVYYWPAHIRKNESAIVF